MYIKNTLPKDLLEKLNSIREHIALLEKVVVAYSGGVDSTLVAKIATLELGKNCVIFIADSPSLARSELLAAREMARKHNLNLREIKTDELDDEHYRKNSVMRCFFCKNNLYAQLEQLKLEFNFNAVLDGANLDDKNDYRPGRKAAAQWKVVSPLLQAELDKEGVRRLAYFLGLQNYNKPASPCLASRLPYGIEVNMERLKSVELAEDFLRKHFSLSVLRVRNYVSFASIEVTQEHISKLQQNEELIRAEFRKLGFPNVKVDELPFESGRLSKHLKGV